MRTASTTEHDDEYRSIARHYDQFLAWALERLWRGVADLLKSKAPGLALDLGCGTGRQARLMAQAGLKVLGLDRSPAMLNRARRALPRPPLLALADAARLPLADNGLDAAAATLMLHELGVDPARNVLAELARALKPDGILAVVDYLPPDQAGQGPTARLAGLFMALIERLAGKRHSRAYRAFLEHGGLPRLADEAGLDCSLERTFYIGRMGLYACTRRDR